MQDIKEVKTVRNENLELKKRIEILERKINSQEQNEKQNNLIVVGILKQEEKGSNKMFSKVITTLQIDINTQDITECYRFKNKEDRPMLVKFARKELKQKLIKKVKELRGLKTRGFLGENKSIFFNDDLTQHNQILFKMAREYKKKRLN